MKTLKDRFWALVAMLIVAGAIYALGVGNPVVLAIQNMVSNIS